MIIDEFDVFLFDLDGVIYIGENPLPGAVESLRRLRQEKKMIRFLTNDPCTTREKIAGRLKRMGITASPEEIITSAWLTAQYLRKQNIRSAYVLGDDHLKYECSQAGVMVVKGEEEAEAVVVGWSGNVSLYDIQEAVKQIHNGAKFIATNADMSFPTSKGPLPATGAVAEMIRASTGKKPYIVGKPNPFMFQKAIESISSKAKVVMIGDNPLTDILGAHQAGIQAILISNGKNAPFPSPGDYRNPDAVIGNLQSLFDDRVKIKQWNTRDFAWPERIEAGVAGIIFNEQQQVLLLKRSDNGLWGIPSGHVEPGEKVEEAIIREIYEETGLEVKVTRLIGIYSDPDSQIFLYPNGEISHFITTCFECKIIGGTLRQKTDETLDARFFAPNDLPENLLTMHPRWLQDALEKEHAPYIR
ncbi:TIGR01459 family HAD-type hydrolase [Aeribacillus pallidus]|nr:TIGR01459 family HAD-type hydrolase [Aeribacillus pallidus]